LQSRMLARPSVRFDEAGRGQDLSDPQKGLEKEKGAATEGSKKGSGRVIWKIPAREVRRGVD